MRRTRSMPRRLSGTGAMRIEIVQRRRRPLSLTSLIDVIFLLLLFFMLSSTFTRFAAVDVTGGRAAAAGAGERPDVLIRLDGEAWSVNGLPFDADAAIGELARLEAAGAETAVILVRGSVPSQALVTAVERIRRRTGLTLGVAR
jgi:biopolymer transport protein ExbD